MNILFDNIIYSKEKQGGISNYWYHITSRYQQNDHAFFYEEKNALENIFRKEMNIRQLVSHPQRSLLLARLGPIAFDHSNTDRLLYHSSFYRKLVTNSKVCEVTTVHDFLHNKHASFIKRNLHNSLKYSSIKRAAGIICVSDNTINDLNKYCKPATHQKVTRIYNGVSDEYRPVGKTSSDFQTYIQQENCGEKFLLFVGARSGYKNFDFAVNVAEQLPSYKMVVVGNPLTTKERNNISSKMRDRLVIATGISNQQLNYLYNQAHVLLYPSVYEGFGIPVAEAMKAGCPVIAMNSSSIPEISGNAARLFDALDLYQFVQEIAHLETADYRAEVIDKGLKNAERFSWNKCAEETTAFYNELYNQ